MTSSTTLKPQAHPHLHKYVASASSHCMSRIRPHARTRNHLPFVKQLVILLAHGTEAYARCLETIWRFPCLEQDNCSRSVPCPTFAGFYCLATGNHNLQSHRFSQGLSPNPSGYGGHSQNCQYYALWIV